MYDGIAPRQLHGMRVVYTFVLFICRRRGLRTTDNQSYLARSMLLYPTVTCFKCHVHCNFTHVKLRGSDSLHGEVPGA